MAQSRSLSRAARTVLAELAEAGPRWSHGYDLCRTTGLKSGTLYPLLIRLDGQGYLEAQWLPAQDARPPRHAYRLTATGRQLAAANPTVAAAPPSPAGRLA